jgi:hypothetical protein
VILFELFRSCSQRARCSDLISAWSSSVRVDYSPHSNIRCTARTTNTTTAAIASSSGSSTSPTDITMAVAIASIRAAGSEIAWELWIGVAVQVD